ncbi:MAG: hypothetical protein WEB53_10965 [Akkermansiaceae bacterium]
MNTIPDEAKLALWLDDELEGEDLASFEAWVTSQPEHLAAREEVRRWRALMASAIPAFEEPPYPDFFNSRVIHAIREQQPKVVVSAHRRPFWKSLLMPVAACAGMVLAFWVGAKSQNTSPEYVVDGAPRAIPVDPLLYTPETGVDAEWFTSEASSMVIVLNGVRAIPDTMDFTATSYVPNERESDSTADNGGDPPAILNP